MDLGLQTPSTVESAPAGYGRSMLISHWAESLDEQTKESHVSENRNRAFVASIGRLVGTTALGVFLGALAAGADTPRDPMAAADRQNVVAGHYKAGGLQRAMLGGGYRSLWETPVSVEVLDLQAKAGGLTPFRRVGGQQTKGLALEGADGRSYTFRGLEKDASHLLDAVDPELKGTVVAKLLDDLMSAQHPASELLATGILEPTGVPFAKWRLVVLPDDPALGEFRKDFAGAIGVFAAYPQPTKGDVPGFLGATEIIDHLEMYGRLEAGEGDAVDDRALLRARLLDILIGDWDRHRKQWRWAKVPGNPRWIPIPEDRDQAFSRYGGFIMGRARGADPRFQNFGPEYGKIGGLTFNGAEQDRRLLVGLSREDFVATARELQALLTDAVIDEAARRMPPEWYAIDGARLTAALESRRDALADVAAKYHEHLANRVDVYMTDQSEHVEAKRLENGDMDVSVRILGPADTLGTPYFHRVFDGKQTEEVRFYALDGNDTVTVTGGGEGPHVRMIGGNGNDTLDARGAGNAKLSDSEGQNRALDAPYDSREYTPPPPPKNAPWIPPRDWTRETVGMPGAAYNADIGLFLGYSLEVRSFGFRKTPYSARHQIRGGWGFARRSGRVDYTGEFKRENRGSSVGLFAFASGVEVLHFYGFGNETPAPGEEDFYNVNANQILVYPTFQVPFAGKGLLTVGPVAKYSQTDESQEQFINVVRPYGAGDFGALAVHGILSWDGRDNLVFPRKGVFAAARATYFPKAWDVESGFGEVNGNLNAYLSSGQLATFAVRFGGKKVYGTYPYMEGAHIGAGGLEGATLAEPENTVRGLRARRFLGDASVWANGELRLRISNITLVVPGDWGLNGFGDVGRVWLEGESSNTWHTGVGGGLWISLLSDRMAFSFGIAHSTEGDRFYFRGGFSY